MLTETNFYLIFNLIILTAICHMLKRLDLPTVCTVLVVSDSKCVHLEEICRFQIEQSVV